MTELRKFGFIFAGYYLAVLAFFIWHHHPIALFAWTILSIVLACTFFFPNLLTPLKYLWDGILKVLNYINTRILFGVLFFAVFTPISFIKKLLGKDSMGLKYDANLKTYRSDCRNSQNDLRRPY
ncbi:MAG: SxtJ family membrane protein [Gammaproteobacteria bacterium]|nr:SxtJ family membrane protein [Gammaproteobacteria bacterium]